MIINIISNKKVLRNILNLLKNNLLVVKIIREDHISILIMMSHIKNKKIILTKKQITKIIKIKIMVKQILNISVGKMIIN